MIIKRNITIINTFGQKMNLLQIQPKMKDACFQFGDSPLKNKEEKMYLF